MYCPSTRRVTGPLGTLILNSPRSPVSVCFSKPSPFAMTVILWRTSSLRVATTPESCRELSVCMAAAHVGLMDVSKTKATVLFNLGLLKGDLRRIYGGEVQIGWSQGSRPCTK